MWLYFKLFTIAVTIFSLPQLKDPFWKPKEFIFIMGALTFIGICWLTENTYRYNLKNKWISLLFIWITLSFGWNFLRHIYFAGDTTSWNVWNITPSLNALTAILLFYHLVEYTDTTERWVSVAKVVCWLGFGLSVYAILQYFGFDQIFRSGGREVTITEGSGKVYYMFTFLGNKMLSSNYIACVTPLYLIFKEKEYLLLMAISLFALTLSRSAFNIGIALSGTIIVLFLQGKWKFCLGIILLGLVLIIAFWKKTNIPYLLENLSFNGRSGFWPETFRKGMETFITGRGLGSLYRDYAANKLILITRHSSHNLFIDLFYELGLGVILLIGYLCSLFKKVFIAFVESRQTKLLIGALGGIISYLLMSMGSFPQKVAPLALLGIIYIVVIEVSVSKRRRIYE